MHRLLTILFSLTIGFVNAQPQMPFGFWKSRNEQIDLFANQKSIAFDGANQRLDISNDTSLYFGNKEINISAWVYMSDATNFTIYASSSLFFKVNASDKLEARLYDSSTAGYIGRIYNTAITSYENNWIFVEFRYTNNGSSSGIDLKINGVVVDDTDANSGSFTTLKANGSIYVGYDGSVYSNGSIDQLVLSKKAYSVSQSKELMTLRDLTEYSLYDSVIVWFEFEDADTSGFTINDRVGNNNATMVNAPLRLVCIPFPYAYQLDTSFYYTNITPFINGSTSTLSSYGGFRWDFDGVNESIEIGDINFSGDWTISFWIYVKTSTPSVTYPINLASTTTGIFTEYGAYGDRWGLFQGSFPPPLANTNLIENQWHHLQVAKSGTDVAFYLNGIPDGVDTITDFDIDNLRIGARSTLYANVAIADVIVFNKKLSDIEAFMVFNNHEPRDDNKFSLSSNIVGYWRGYNSTNTASGVLDMSGNAHNGTMTNMENADIGYSYPIKAFDLDNQNEGSFDFNGTNEYVNIPDSANLSFTENHMFISGWINMDDATNFTIANKSGEYLLWVNSSDKLEARFIDDSTSSYIGRTYNTAITSYENKWIFVECSFYASNLEIRLNGVRVDDTDANSGTFVKMRDTSNPLYLAYNGTNYANGNISHVSISGLNSSICQCQEMYNNGSPVDPSKITFNTDIISHWALDQRDDVSGTIYDIVGTNNGTSINTPTLDTLTYPTN